MYFIVGFMECAVNITKFKSQIKRILGIPLNQ